MTLNLALLILALVAAAGVAHMIWGIGRLKAQREARVRAEEEAALAARRAAGIPDPPPPPPQRNRFRGT
jgi:type II secretory pathway pseudopilin PulG